MFRQKVKISSLFTDELFTAKVGSYSELSILRTPDITNLSILRTKLCSPSFSH